VEAAGDGGAHQPALPHLQAGDAPRELGGPEAAIGLPQVEQPDVAVTVAADHGVAVPAGGHGPAVVRRPPLLALYAGGAPGEPPRVPGPHPPVPGPGDHLPRRARHAVHQVIVRRHLVHRLGEYLGVPDLQPPSEVARHQVPRVPSPSEGGAPEGPGGAPGPAAAPRHLCEPRAGEGVDGEPALALQAGAHGGQARRAGHPGAGQQGEVRGELGDLDQPRLSHPRTNQAV